MTVSAMHMFAGLPVVYRFCDEDLGFARTALRNGELLLGVDVAHVGRLSKWWCWRYWSSAMPLPESLELR